EQSEVDTVKGTVSTHTTTLSQHATAIASKAEKSVVDTISGKVSTNTTTISQNATAISSKAEQSEVDTVKGTVSSHTSTLEQQASAISARLTQSQVDNLVSGKGYSTVSYVDNQMSATAEGIRSEMTAIENKIPSEIGGRNYALDTSSQYKNETVPMWQKPITERVYFKDVGLEIGDFVTLRMYIKVPKSEKYGICARINFYREDGTYTNKSGDYILTGSEGNSVVTI